MQINIVLAQDDNLNFSKNLTKKEVYIPGVYFLAVSNYAQLLILKNNLISGGCSRRVYGKSVEADTKTAEYHILHVYWNNCFRNCSFKINTFLLQERRIQNFS